MKMMNLVNRFNKCSNKDKELGTNGYNNLFGQCQ
jgi:hypothetical protein